MPISAGNKAAPLVVPWHVGDAPCPVPATPPHYTDPRELAAKCSPEMFQRLKQVWEKVRWKQAGAPPLPFCPYYVIGEHPWPHVGVEQRARITRALHDVSPTLDIIYDPATAEGDSPAYHLYTRYADAHYGSDLLVYEYSLQERLGAPWPNGVPLIPSLDVIPRIAATLKCNLYAGSKEQIHQQVMADKLSAAWSLKVAVDRRDAALSQFTFTDIMDPYLRKARVQVPVNGLRPS